MSSVDQLLLILLAIYLSECLLYLRDGAVAVGRWLGSWQAIAGGLAIGKSGGELTFISPLPWEAACLAEAWPIAVSAEGIVSTAGWPGSVTPDDVVTAIAWEDVRKLHTHGRWLHINDVRFAECASAAMGNHLAGLLQRWQGKPAAEREKQIRAALKASVDLSTARERWSQTRGNLAQLRVGSTALFLAVFTLVPALDRTLPIFSWVFWIAGTIVVLAVYNLLALRRVLRACSELTPEYRFKSCFVAALSPINSMRGPQTAAAHLLPLHHPLTIAATIGTPEFFQNMAAKVWRELQFPLPPTDPDPTSLRNRIVGAYTSAQIAALEPLLREHNLEPTTLLLPPEPDSPEVVAYCPRCLGQFNTLDGRCQTCGDRPVVPLPAA